MKKFLSGYIFLAMISVSAMDREITTITKGISDKSLSNDTKNLALAYTLLHEQKFFPIQVGTKSISYDEFGQLNPDQRDLVNNISHPGCCARLCGFDYSIATPSAIERLEKEMPYDFMKDHKILKKKNRLLFCKSCYSTQTQEKWDLCSEAGAWSAFGIFPAFTGAFTLFLGGFVSNCMPAVLIAGGVQCGAAAVYQVGLWSYTGIRSCFCYDTHEYTFGQNKKSEESEEENFSSSSSSSSGELESHRKS